MSVLSDITIRELCLDTPNPMIFPFFEKSVNELNGKKIPSYGLSSYGYDVRLEPHFKIFSAAHSCGVIDILNPPGDDIFHEVKGESCVLPPNSYLLSYTMEYFNLPRDVIIQCLGKSTWARLGVEINVTPIEPEFFGNVVIEVANLSPIPITIYAGVGISQFLFHRGDRPCETSYADRNGKYNGQTGIKLAGV